MNEFELIRRYFDRVPTRHAELGIGDDAAILAAANDSMVITTDMLVSGRHFFADAPPDNVGFKCLAVNVSDLAAMGAKPIAFTLALALPEPNADWLEAFSSGLFAAADQFACELVGGDTTRGPLTISVTAIGTVARGTAIRRDQAQPGDDVWVSGYLGGAAAALQARQIGAEVDSDLAQCLDRPVPRIELGRRLSHIASAAIDVSDGLMADLGHIADRSRLAITLCFDDLPVHPAIGSSDAKVIALTGGDDYELAFCSAPENRTAIDGLARQLALPLTRIGHTHAGQGVHVQTGAGHPVTHLPADGYDHFAN